METLIFRCWCIISLGCCLLLKAQQEDITLNYTQLYRLENLNGLSNENKIYPSNSPESLLKNALASLKTGNIETGIQTLEKATEIANKGSEDQELNVKLWGSLGIAYSVSRQYKEALSSFFKALTFVKNDDNKLLTARINGNIASVYAEIGDVENAEKYFTNCATGFQSISTAESAHWFAEIGNLYLSQNKKSEANKYLIKSEKIFSEISDKKGIGFMLMYLGDYYDKEKNNQKALDYLLKAENAFHHENDTLDKARVQNKIAQVYFAKGDRVLSTEFATKSLASAKPYQQPDLEMQNEKILYENHFADGHQVDALIHLRNYDIAKEKLLKIENLKEKIKNELNYEYQTNQLKQDAKKSRYKLMATFAILVSFGILVFLFMQYRNQQERTHLQLEKQLTEYEHKALHLQMNPHFIFNCHAAISSFILQNGKEEAVKYLAKFSKLMRLTLEISKESNIPLEKEILSLQHYLELEQLRFNHKFDFEIYRQPEIEDDTSIPSLLLQPYVENAILHGVAPKEGKGKIDIRFLQENNLLICEIIDNGIGIENSRNLKKEKMNVHKSMALEITQKRLETLEKLEKKKVSLSIDQIQGDDNKSKGTKVRIQLPLEYIAN